MSHPPKKQTKQTSQVTFRKEQVFVGPVLPPEILSEYEKIQPGFAERLLQMAEKEQAERHKNQSLLIQTEREINIATSKNIKRGQWLALISVFIIVGFCSYLAFLGDTDAASYTALGIIVALAGVFISGRVIQSQLKEKQEKKEK
jgi:uncharacterized membrane protein